MRTAEDFGVNGENPSNAELLDWLAVEFRESGWDVKRLFRLLVTSAAYRQAALCTPEKLERDPQNRLLSRGPRFRMDAEMVRDYALAASGLLARKIGGPSVKPYQPEGVWEAVAMPESNTRYYRMDGGEGLYRRSLYTFWKRAAPPASMEIFNAPTPGSLHRAARADEHAAAGAGDAERSAVRRGGPQPGPGRASGKAARPPRAGWPLRRGGFWPGRCARRRAARPWARSTRCCAITEPAPARRRNCWPSASRKPIPRWIAPLLAAWTMLANELMNLDEVLNK